MLVDTDKIKFAENLIVDPVTLVDNRLEPVAGLKNNGYARDDYPTNSNHNWLFNEIWKAIKQIANEECNFLGKKIFDDTTDSSSAVTGAIVTPGGIGLAKSIFAGLIGFFQGGTRRGEAGTVLKEKIVPIGDWNMDTTTSVDVLHGLGADFKKIRAIFATVRGDSDTNLRPLNTSDASGACEGAVGNSNDTATNLTRLTGGFFDQAGFSATSFNRGFIYITYEA